MGHRSHAGPIREREWFGVKLCRVDIPGRACGAGRDPPRRNVRAAPARDSSQPRQNGPAFQERLVGRAHAGDLDHVIQDRKPDKAVILRPLRLHLHRLECLGRIGSVEAGRVVNAELHGGWPLFCLD